MEQKGHSFTIVARQKDVTFQILKSFGTPFISRGKGGSNVFTKLLYLPKAIIHLVLVAKRNRTDLFLSFASSYAAIASAICQRPHIALDDTEHASLEIALYSRFSDVIITPRDYGRDLGSTHVKYHTYMELMYLHPEYFEPALDVRRVLGLNPRDRFAIVRLVNWTASHDVGHNTITISDKMSVIKYLAEQVTVFVSAEGKFPEELNAHKIPDHPALFHDMLRAADLYLGEGATAASEAAILGTPAIYINELSAGAIDSKKPSGMIFQSTDSHEICNQIEIFLAMPPAELQDRVDIMLDGTVDLTAELVDIVSDNAPSWRKS